jgi:glyoxylase-like metal-dependent hydrolase (beta-lactamase superfamily II)/rhodanese-related sulfurtransferase
MATIVAIDTPTLGDRSYLVHDGRVALVVDPQRDIDRVLALAGDAAVEIVAVFETHLHNDYVTGGLALAQATGAAYHVNAEDDVAFDRVAVRDGDVVEVGPDMRVQVLATPGHTFTHLSYVLESPGEPAVVFTGGSLLFGSTGRPDLLGPEHTATLARLQHESAHRLSDRLAGRTAIMPTHGFGSFCSATQSDVTSSTIEQERRSNPVLTEERERYVADLIAGLDVWPAYYARMGPMNAAGPAPADLSPPQPADPSEIHRRIDRGEWVVDLRGRVAFAAGHVRGSLNFGIDGKMSTYLGWLIPWGTPLTLLGDTPEQVAEAQRELMRIGIDRVDASATGGPQDWTEGRLDTFARATFTDLTAVRHHRPVVILDVRRELEWREAHIDGAVHVPLHELPGGLGRVPAGEVWVHCASGYRASVAASFLAAAGREVIAVDDDFDRAAAAGLGMRPSTVMAAGSPVTG